jgi:hypothetical protein
MLLLALPAASGASAQVAVVSDHEIDPSRPGGRPDHPDPDGLAEQLVGHQPVGLLHPIVELPEDLHRDGQRHHGHSIGDDRGRRTVPNQCESNCSAQ